VAVPRPVPLRACRVRPSTSASAGGGAWTAHLDQQLSGGQRTLVTLALLLAAARAGGRWAGWRRQH
jgi:hypothetical protein